MNLCLSEPLNLNLVQIELKVVILQKIMKMVKIGNIELPEFPLLLAPMEDVSDPPFRRLCKTHGADMMYSEFISSEGLIRDAIKSRMKLDIFDYERPVGIQIFGGDEEAMALSAKIVEAVEPDLVDINFGCPVKKVVCKGAGAGVLKDIDLMVRLTKAVIKPMMKAKSGSIINMTSVVGVKGNAGQANYAASKAGVIGFTKSIALELGSRNIRCNAIAPGFIETEMTAALDEKTVQGWREGIPLKRGGQPEDVANACVFFGSEMSSYVSGQVLNVDGGMLT